MLPGMNVLRNRIGIDGIAGNDVLGVVGHRPMAGALERVSGARWSGSSLRGAALCGAATSALVELSGIVPTRLAALGASAGFAGSVGLAAPVGLAAAACWAC